MSKILFVIGILALALSFFLGLTLLDDKTPPTLQIPSTSIVIGCINDEALFDQVAAFDGKLDITERVVIENKQLLLEKKPAFITYVVSDKNGNIAKQKRPATYVDKNEISIVKLQDLIIEQSDDNNSFVPSEYFAATDSCGIDLSDKLYLSQTLDLKSAGTKPIQLKLKYNDVFQYTDMLTVKAVQQNTPENPQIETDTPAVFVFNENPVHLALHSTFLFMSHIETIEDAVDSYALLSRRVRLTNAPDMNEAGTYVVTYSVTNSRGISSSNDLIVIVEEAEE